MNFIKKWNSMSIVVRIIIGLVLGTALGLLSRLVLVEYAGFSLDGLKILGDLFVGALKGVAPLLVFFLVMGALLKHKKGEKTNLKLIIGLYLVGTVAAAIVAVGLSFISPVTLTLEQSNEVYEAPEGLIGVLQTVLMNIVINPVTSIATANYIGVLAWAVVIALALKAVNASDNTRTLIDNVADALTVVVRWVINLAPFGILGLTYKVISEEGVTIFTEYAHLLAILVGSMVIVLLVVNPIIAYIGMRRNPYPLIFKCIKVSGLTAFFTRSSAANIPVNMELCEELGLDEETYSISIPLGATINMAGAAITITVLTLAAANTVGVDVTIGQAILLSILAAISACGASGVSGGSILLIPLACNLFNISDDIAGQVMAIGFLIGVIQDSCETALNSSTDVVFTAVAEYTNKRLGKH